MFKYFIYGFLAVIPLSFLADYAYSAETRPYMYRVQQTAQLQQLLNSGSVPVTYETVATTPAGQQVTRYTTRNTVMNATRLGSIARSAVGGPAVLAATAAFLAYDYFYNEDTQTWQANPSYPDGYDSFTGTCRRTTNNTIGEMSLAECVADQQEYVSSGGHNVENVRRTASTTSSTTWCSDVRLGNGNLSTCANGNRWISTTNLPQIASWPSSISVVPLDVSDSDLGDSVSASSPNSVSDILNDPIQSGTWPDRWPEMEPVTEEIEDQLGHDIEGGPAPSNPDQTITDGSTYNPPESVTDSGGSMSAEWPTFCSWATVVCNFIDWVMEEPEFPEVPDLPYVDVEVETDTYDSGLPMDGICPPPEVYQFFDETFEIPYDFFCDFALSARPFVIGSAYMGAIFIMLFGVRRG